MHTIATRPPTDEERHIIFAESRPNIGSWGCLVVLFGASGFGMGAAGRWLGGFVNDSLAEIGQYIGWAAAALSFLLCAVAYYRFERQKRLLGQMDVAAQQVQEIHVREPRVVEIALISDNEPILCFDVGDNRLLYLQGQWLRDADTYGVDAPEGDPNEETVNGLWGTAAFPSSEFTITRLPHSGHVLAIRPVGDYLPPQETLDVLKTEYSFADSELFVGQLEEIGQALEKAHQEQHGH